MAQALARKEPPRPSGHLHEVTASALRVPKSQSQAQSRFGSRPKSHSPVGHSSQVKSTKSTAAVSHSWVGHPLQKPGLFSSLSSSQRHTNSPYCPIIAHLFLSPRTACCHTRSDLHTNHVRRSSFKSTFIFHFSSHLQFVYLLGSSPFLSRLLLYVCVVQIPNSSYWRTGPPFFCNNNNNNNQITTKTTHTSPPAILLTIHYTRPFCHDHDSAWRHQHHCIIQSPKPTHDEPHLLPHYRFS